jgi:ComF family protein
VLRRALVFAANLVWPARCAGCDAWVQPELAFCDRCTPSLVSLAGACPGCALPREQSCRFCARAPRAYSAATAALAYGGPVADALLRFKHGGRLDLARPLGRLLVPALRQAGAPAVDAVLPVPLHPRRLRARGFNQALELLRAAGAVDRAEASIKLPALWVNTLQRIRDTPSLGHHPPHERRSLVAGAFHVADPSRVASRRLLVVDDVMTTGSTLHACAEALRAAGAAEVRVTVLTRAFGS